MNFKLCIALAILSFSAYARGDWKLNAECSEEDYEMGLCEEGRHLRRDYYAGEDDDEADYCAD